jgi:hypothetical protein
MQGPGEELKYRLVSVVVHHGAGADSGSSVAANDWHFTAATRGEDAQWCHCNDAVVEPLGTTLASLPAAFSGGYLYVYVRQL